MQKACPGKTHPRDISGAFYVYSPDTVYMA